VATLEDAAEELVVRLKGLDAEIEESEGKFEGFKSDIEGVAGELDEQWTAFIAAVTSFGKALAEEQQKLDEQARETLQGLSDAQAAVAQDAGEARTEIVQARGQLDALGEHAKALDAGMDALVASGEAAPKALAERARELDQELTRLFEETRDFVRDEMVPAIEAVATDVTTRCQELNRVLAEQLTTSLQQSYDEWETAVDELEQQVATDSFKASHPHADQCVEAALEECETACDEKVDELKQLVALLVTQLQELATDVGQSANSLVAEAGAELVKQLGEVHTAGASAVAALDNVKQTLASYTFLEV
jgi:DNA repair exonuclease SbcCD ATPase subunit